MSESFALIAGGGTAGHLYPGLAVAEALVSLGKRRNEIHFFTSDREIDNKLLTAAEFSLHAIGGEWINSQEHLFLNWSSNSFDQINYLRISICQKI